jgi:hypothetical protein
MRRETACVLCLARSVMVALIVLFGLMIWCWWVLR